MEKLTVEECALRLGVKTTAVHNRIKRGTLKSVKEGRKRFVFLDEAESKAKKIPSSSDGGGLLEHLKTENLELKQRIEKLEKRFDEKDRELKEINAEVRGTLQAFVQYQPNLIEQDKKPEEKEPSAWKDEILVPNSLDETQQSHSDSHSEKKMKDEKKKKGKKEKKEKKKKGSRWDSFTGKFKKKKKK